jgi:hypothetical protein
VLPGNLLDAVAVLLPSGHQFLQRIFFIHIVV